MSSSQLKTLSDKFNTLLTEYKNTYNKYINNINDTSLTTIDNSAFNGSSTLKTNTNSTLENCKKSCSSDTSCSGATFLSNNNKCVLSSGNGNVTNAINSTAIVQKGVYYSYQLQKINQQLMDINQEISNTMTQTYSGYQDNLNKSQEQNKAIQQNYTVLMQEREEIEKMIRQFQTLNSAQENGDTAVTMYYYNYIILLIIVVLLVLLFINFSISSDQIGGGKKCDISKTLPVILLALFGFYYVFKN
jgi:NADH:ubiquinone oxidoreductase subunit 3 (subunit A)